MRYNDWPPYVPVAQRRAKAMKEVEKLRKKGKDISPVVIPNRTIAVSFWGKSWCKHLESFMDYENRLPRGRTYVRNGSVCHLEILPGRIEAMVSGSHIYKVAIDIAPLPNPQWQSIKSACAGQVGSMLELLQGKLSKEVMAIVADQQSGLFPKPKEIKLSCSCPDWATMCKHVAAVLYGVGNRLDTQPELLFVLRKVDAQDLISSEMALPAAAPTEDALATDQLGAIFGIEMDEQAGALSLRETPADLSPGAPTTGKTKSARKPAARKTAAAAKKTAPSGGKRTKSKLPNNPNQEITGPWILALRTRYGLSRAQLSRLAGVSEASLMRWENIPGPIKLQRKTRNSLLLFAESKEE